jgi:exopolysaccharide biosynthesis polyprenyl glycosylphosphotransferase
MGHLAKIIDFQTLRRPKAASTGFALGPGGYSDLARLVPGLADSVSVGTQSDLNGASIYGVSAPRPFLSRSAAELLPRFLHRIEATMLAPAMRDAALIILVFAFETSLLRSPRHAFELFTLLIFVVTFLIFAIQEDLYLGKKTTFAENAAAFRALGWTTLIAILSLRWLPARGSALEVIALSLGSLGALAAARQFWRALHTANNHARNVLIVGSGIKAKQVSDAIHLETNSSRLVKGYLAEIHMRNSYGPAMLSRIAREEFVDEIIIASADPKVAEIATQEARRNQLDVKIAPEICVPPSANQVTFENVGGIPLLKICDHRPPGYRLALKRSLDVVLALCGGGALSPLLLLIAVLIKLDSAGPVFYRAPRTGRKGRQFVCHKFRTMIPEADAMKNDLRARNEREGAFFKIGNDPRITRIGRLLRRYSLDELPQLWNVVVGDMSLVGPRPHPPDDVSQYKIQHLQRLDFVPGITGLWQVTARRDPSFERSVALDVEYIKNWNLWLDVRILCKTVAAVLEGSGA